MPSKLHHQGTFYDRPKFPGYNPFRVFADFDANQGLAQQAPASNCGTKSLRYIPDEVLQ
jgi:hypothetical protein